MSKVYHGLVNAVDKYVPNKVRPLWEHPAGPKTIFFWAPAFKWGLVFAGLNDMLNVPPEKISFNQSVSLAVTGFIWARFSVTIIPVNYSLFTVNLFLGLFQTKQVIKAYRYQKQQALLEQQQKESTDKIPKNQENYFQNSLTKSSGK